MKYIIVFLAFLFFIACSSSKKSNEKTKNYSETVSDSLYSIRVSFISIGSGTDRKVRREYEEYIKQFEESNGVTIMLDKALWGKEGEIDFCIKLTGLSKSLQSEFLESTKEKLKNSKLVRIYENTTCKNKK